MKQPRSQEDWKEVRRHKNGGKGILYFERKLFNSEAFKELAKKPKHVLVLLCAVHQLWCEKKPKNDKNRIRFKDGGRLYLIQNELKERFGMANDTIAKAKKRLVDMGFLDVVEVGDVFHAGVYRWSYRWENYPKGDYHPKNARPAGKVVYPEHSLKNPEHPIHKARRQKKQEQEKISVQESNVDSIRELNVNIAHSIQQLNEEVFENRDLPIQ